ncbi:hypothetical protein SAMN05421770_1011137 [Granulicella rosea]|uniref:Uncharacterized protein n=1 Tax=Granulicella rosea TaxID=474952 RepID=A0A239ESH4_9BACT|nr:hypothetical protein [Granulicella rosea]SNS47605.1 hypothetical protein SAMN05421770_1011137 [Granulicella rosea]
MTEFPHSNPPLGADHAQRPGTHWTEDDFSNYMIGLEVAPAVMRHLDICAACSAEARNFQLSIESFNDVTLEWSENRPYARALVPETKPSFGGWLPSAAWAVAAAVVFSVGLPMALQHRNASVEDRPANVQPDTQVASLADENSAAAIDRDNKLMMAVAFELDRADPQPVGFGEITASKEHKRLTEPGNP